MDRTRYPIIALSLLVLELTLPAAADAYSKYIVGDEVGWVANFTNPINYTDWASGNNFSLGDTLVFKYTANHTVVQTFLEDTYTQCNFNDNNDTTYQVWSSEGSTESDVVLTTTGPSYFLCSAYDGLHCLGGMRFAINVAYGMGLPPSPSPSQSGSTGTVPNTQSNSPPNNASGGAKEMRISALRNYCLVLFVLIAGLPFLG